MNALKKLIDIELEAREFGFNWPDFQMIIDQATDECREIKEAIASGETSLRVREEIGDLLHCAVSMCVFEGFNVEQIIKLTYEKFQGRIKTLKYISGQHGYKTLEGQPIELLLDFWSQAKTRQYAAPCQNNIVIRNVLKEDIKVIVNNFEKIGWSKPASLFENYLVEQHEGERIILGAFYDNEFAGYVTLKWHSDYPSFLEQNIPEINDLNVLPSMRNRGIGSALLEKCEQLAGLRSSKIGIGVGLSRDYGAAQRLYVSQGYIPDGRGITYYDKEILWGANILLDDDLILWFIKELK